jgi:phenylpyruvate tautomerase PptA (4-oxalocrotonate tautomerase family)
MPIYTCTIRESSLSADIKEALAREMARVHSSVNHVPTTYVNVAFTSCRPTVFTPTAFRRTRSLSAAGYGPDIRKQKPRVLPPKSPLQSPGSPVSPPSESSSSSKAVQRDSPSRAVVSCPSPVTNKPGPQARASRTTT